METTECLRVLDEAIQFEQEGRAFYQEAARKTKNPYGKTMFEAIADAELRHMETIRGVHETLTKENRWPDQCPYFESPSQVRSVFEEARTDLDEKVSADTGDLDAVRTAIEYEEKGLRLYQNLAKDAADPVEKELYTLLAAEERGHVFVLRDIEQYYEDPAQWFSMKEHSHWDGS